MSKCGFTPDERKKALGAPLVLYAVRENVYPQVYLEDPSYGDAALEAILKGRQILVRVPNAHMVDNPTYNVSAENTALFSPVLTYHVPNYDNDYLYLFYLRDEKQTIDLSAAGMGSIQVPIYGQLKMKLSKKYTECPLDHKTFEEHKAILDQVN